MPLQILVRTSFYLNNFLMSNIYIQGSNFSRPPMMEELMLMRLQNSSWERLHALTVSVDMYLFKIY